MAYIGAEPLPGQNREVDDISSGFNGSTTAFTLQVSSVNVSPESANNILISLGGVIQNPGTDYTIAASTLTFTTAPASGLDFFGLILGAGINTATVADGVITSSKLASDLSLTGDVSIADKIVHTGDTNTAIRFPAADTFTAETGGSERLRIASDGKIGIGITSPNTKLDISAPSVNSSTLSTTNCKQLGQWIQAASGSNTSGNIQTGIAFAEGHSGLYSIDAGTGAAQHLAFFTGATAGVAERLRIDTSGKVGVNDSTPDADLSVSNSDTSQNAAFVDIGKAGGNRLKLGYEGNNCFFGGTSSTAMFIFKNNVGSTDNPQASGTERMRIDSSGNLLIGTTSTLNSGRAMVDFTGGGRGLGIKAPSDASGSQVLHFYAGTTQVGNVNVSTSATSYATSSDYRLKENVVAISDGITRLKTLKPYRFNFKVDASTTVDGFFAHEVTAVPEAITGTKDEVDSDNNPVYQGIDQSKLVPLLTAALQESVKKIETLETKVAALEAA